MKKLVLLLLALALSLSVFAGCGEGTPSAGSGDPAGDSTAGTAGEPGSGAMDRVDLIYYIRSQEQDDAATVQAAMDEYFLEKLNCTVRVIAVNDWVTKMPLVFSAGEQVDLTYDQANTGYYTNAGNNIYLPLDDLVNQYGQGLLAEMAANCPGLIDAPRVAGELYGIPCQKQTAQCEAWYFRKDIADEIGLDVDNLVSLQDLEPFLRQVKENYPEMTPYYVSAGTGVHMEWITDAIRDNPDRYEEVNGAVNLLLVDLDEDKVLNHYETDWDLDRYQTLQSWQSNGLVNSDAATTTTAGTDMFRVGKTWMIGAGGAPTTMSSLVLGYGTDFYRWRSTGPIANTYQNTTALTCIPRTSADPDRAMMALNLFHTDPEIINLFNSGVEGVHYVVDENGRFSLPEGATSRQDTSYNYGFETFFGNMMLNNLWDTEDEDRYEELKEYNRTARQSRIMGFYADTSGIATEYAAVEAIRTQYAPLLRGGVVSDVQDTLDEMNGKMYANGLQKIIDEVQRQYDEFVAAGNKN